MGEKSAVRESYHALRPHVANRQGVIGPRRPEIPWCIDPRDAVVSHWKKHSTWVAPPVFLQNVVNLGPLRLIEGHTRLGTLRGTLEHGVISAESLHSAWVGA